MTDQEFNQLVEEMANMVEDGSKMTHAVEDPADVIPLATLCCLQQIAAGISLVAKVLHDQTSPRSRIPAGFMPREGIE